MIRFRQRFLVAAWKRLHFYVAARKRQCLLVADSICALATASVLSLSLTSCALLTSLALTSCSHTRYIPLPESHSRDSLSTVVHKKVYNTYIDRTHTEKLHRGSDPACSCAGTTSRSSACSYDLPDRPKTTDWGLSLISGFRVDTLVVKDSIYVEKFTDVEVHDTVTVTHRDSIPYPVEVPVEVPTPIPRFYRNSTIGFWLIILALLAYIALRIYLHR